MEPLSFIQHTRQSYATVVPCRDGEDEYSIGGYPQDSDGGVDERGEFRIILHRFNTGYTAGLRSHSPADDLSPQICVFHDAYPALREAIEAGLLEVLAKPMRSADELTDRLLAIGLRDNSDSDVRVVAA